VDRAAHSHWDRYGKPDDTASCWIRTAQLQTSGSMVLPRVGWEVIVEFLEGNPDRPLVTGRVYNARFMPPYALPEGKSRTAIQTASSPGGSGRNEIRMEDKAGAEEMHVGAQKDTTLVTANDKTVSVAVDASKDVKVDSTTTIGADQTIQVTNGYQSTVKAAQTVSVGGNRTVEVNAVYGLTSGGASATSVGGTHFEMDGSPLQALLALAVKAATEAAQAEAQQALQQLDQAVQAKVDQVMGPIHQIQQQAESVKAGMDAVSNGNLAGAADAFGAAAGMPGPDQFAGSLDRGGGGGGEAARGAPAGGGWGRDDAQAGGGWERDG
jgi:type VI secretion system secreted protein VgrG